MLARNKTRIIKPRGPVRLKPEFQNPKTSFFPLGVSVRDLGRNVDGTPTGLIRGADKGGQFVEFDNSTSKIVYPNFSPEKLPFWTVIQFKRNSATSSTIRLFQSAISGAGGEYYGFWAFISAATDAVRLRVCNGGVTGEGRFEFNGNDTLLSTEDVYTIAAKVTGETAANCTIFVNGVRQSISLTAGLSGTGYNAGTSDGRIGSTNHATSEAYSDHKQYMTYIAEGNPPDTLLQQLSLNPWLLLQPKRTFIPFKSATATLAIQEILQSQSVESINLTQASNLTIDDISQSQATENIVLTVSGELSVSDATQNQSVEQIGLIQQSLLSIVQISQSQSIETIDLTQASNISVDELFQSQAVESVTLDLGVALSVAGVTQSQDVEQVTLTQQSILAIVEIVQSQQTANLDLTQSHVLVIDELGQAQLLDACNVFDDTTTIGYVKASLSIKPAVDAAMNIQVAVKGSVTINRNQ